MNERHAQKINNGTRIQKHATFSFDKTIQLQHIAIGGSKHDYNICQDRKWERKVRELMETKTSKQARV